MAGVCDFVFLVDGTGSMSDCIGALRDNLRLFVDHLTSANSPVTDWRGKVLVYRDSDVDGDLWLEDNPFVHRDAEALRAQIARVEAKGGGDEPETLLDALHRLAAMPQTDEGAATPDPLRWRYRSDAVRVVIVFTDATYKPTVRMGPAAGATVADVKQAVIAGRLLLYLFAPEAPCYEELAACDGAEWHALPGPRFDRSLARISRDTEAFQALLRTLAQSIRHSVLILR